MFGCFTQFFYVTFGQGMFWVSVFVFLEGRGNKRISCLGIAFWFPLFVFALSNGVIVQQSFFECACECVWVCLFACLGKVGVETFTLHSTS